MIKKKTFKDVSTFCIKKTDMSLVKSHEYGNERALWYFALPNLYIECDYLKAAVF